MKRTHGAIGMLLVLAMASTAQAATVIFNPADHRTLEGNQILMDLVADFGSTSVLGGTIDLKWDPAVISLDSFTFGPAAADRDQAFDIIDHATSSSLSVGLGNFNGMLLGPGTVLGSLRFDVIGGAGTATSVTLADSQRYAGFFDVTSQPIPVDYGVGSLTVVPLPAAGWLLLSAMGLLALPARRMRAS